MTAKFNQDFITFAGDDVAPIFTVQDSSGAAVDISTVTQITWLAHLTADDAALITKTKTAGQISFVTNGTDGKFQVAINAADTASLSGWYQHLASITDGTGKITTVEVGRMQVGVRPTWTYNQAQIANVPLFQVRRWIGDVIQNDQQLQDSEILYFISERQTVLGAAADCARAIAGQYSRKVDVTSPGEIRTAHGSQAAKYAALAKQLEMMARSRGAGINPYMGGISVADKTLVQSNSDRVQPAFVLAMTDNTLPVMQVGNENLNAPLPAQGA